MIPAFQISSAHLSESLKQGARTAGSSLRQSRFRNSFVVIQTALALILLAGAGFLIKSFVCILGIDPGFNPHGILTARIDLPASQTHDEWARFFEQASERLKILPGVESVGMVNSLPLGSDSDIKTRFVTEGSAASDQGFPVAEVRATTPDYFRVMGIPLLSGRFFKGRGEEQSLSIIIGSTLARRFFPHQDPLGRRLNMGPEFLKPAWCTIVGVVGDVREFGLVNEPQNEIYFDDVDSGLSVVMRTSSDPLMLATSVRRVVGELDREATVRDVRTGEQLVSHSLASRRFSMILLGLFAGIAVALAVVGTYGVISYSVVQRTHEIGIRMALGAERQDVLRSMLRQGLGLTITGVATGLVGALAMGRFIAGLLYGVRPTDPETLVEVSLILTVVSLVASYLPARRATKVDPMTALRYE